MTTRRHRARSLTLTAAGAALATLVAAATTACDPERAVDCARFAVDVALSAERLEDAVITSVLDDDTEALEELAEDVEELQDRIEDTDVTQAAESVLQAAENIVEAAREGEVPDLEPLADATTELTTICGSSDDDNDGGE